MRGMNQLVTVRRKGLKPAGLVYINDLPTPDWQTNWLKEESAPTICTFGVALHEIDLRPVVGLSVAVDGVDGERVRKLAGEARKAGAAAIVATFGNQGVFFSQGDGKWQIF